MTEVETMSHVALLDAYDSTQHDSGSFRGEVDGIRAEILRRMDSAGTSCRQEIEPHAPDHQR